MGIAAARGKWQHRVCVILKCEKGKDVWSGWCRNERVHSQGLAEQRWKAQPAGSDPSQPPARPNPCWNAVLILENVQMHANRADPLMWQLFLFIKKQLTALKIMGPFTFHLYPLCLVLIAKNILKPEFPMCLSNTVSVYFSDTNALNNYPVFSIQKL